MGVIDAYTIMQPSQVRICSCGNLWVKVGPRVGGCHGDLVGLANMNTCHRATGLPVSVNGIITVRHDGRDMPFGCVDAQMKSGPQWSRFSFAIVVAVD